MVLVQWSSKFDMVILKKDSSHQVFVQPLIIVDLMLVSGKNREIRKIITQPTNLRAVEEYG
jgi:hypothetical protein